MICIYKITNPIKEIYIGQTINYNKRINQYKKLNCKKQLKIYNSLIKYGIENHIFEIVEECNIDELNDKERYYQELYNVIDNGLNCKFTNSQDKSGFLSDDVKNKISISMTGKIKSQEIKNKISISKTGFKYSKESRLKMSKSAKSRLKVKHKTIKDEIKTIYQYDLNNNLIKEWYSFRNIIDSYPKGIRTIWKCLRNEQKNIIKLYMVIY